MQRTIGGAAGWSGTGGGGVGGTRDRNRVNCRPGGGKRQLEQPLIQPDVSHLAPDLDQQLPLTERCAWLFEGSDREV